MLITSRCFVLEFEKRDLSTKCLVPFVDMMNHSINAKITWGVDDKRDGIIAKAITNITMGEEVTMDYGYMPSAKLFLNYGFVFPSEERT